MVKDNSAFAKIPNKKTNFTPSDSCCNPSLDQLKPIIAFGSLSYDCS